MKALTTFLMTLLFCVSLSASEIIFEFSNGVITGTDTTYYEFDVTARATETGLLLGDAMVYINYDTLGFGASIKLNDSIAVEMGELLQGDIMGAPKYGIVNIADNTPSKVAISTNYIFWESFPAFGNEVPTTATQYLHIKMQIEDSLQTSKLSFDSTLMDGQQYLSDNAAKFDTVTAADSLNAPLRYNPSAIRNIADRLSPKSFKLHQNHPNPFNPSTTLNIDVPKNTENITISVYNILGQRVAKLYSGSMLAGAHKMHWNGKSSSGALMPSGIYFAVLKGQNIFQSVKMTLLK